MLRRGAAPEYQPHPLGIPAAREALAAALSTPGDAVSPGDLVLTASTSESYSYLFKLFADPEDEALTAAPSYPLLDSLAALDSLVLCHFHLAPGRRFALDPETVELALSPRTRLLALIHPGNPTGRFLSAQEREAVDALCASRSLPLISDEVFADYSFLADPHRAGPAAASGEALSFSLGGLSKSAGLPSWKLGWIRVGGPSSLRRQALAALELVADSYLSVAGEPSFNGRVVPPARVGAGCRIAGDARVGSLAVLGDNVAVGEGTTIEQAVVFNGAQIGPNCRLRYCILGAGARVGANTHIDSGAVLGEGVTVGADNVLSRGARIFPGVSLPDGAIKF